MMRQSKKGRFLILLGILAPLMVSVATAAELTANHSPMVGDPGSLSDRMDRLEARLREVETEVTQLRRQKQAVQEDLEHQKQEAAALRAQLAQPVASSQTVPQSQIQAVPDKRSRFTTPTTQFGARVGWQTFPYRQHHGGLLYSFYFDHRLAGEDDGIPLGEVDAEVNVGVARSGDDSVVNFSTATLTTYHLDYRQTMLFGWIGMKYYLNYFAPLGVRPYAIGGPGIWGDVVESPPVYIGQQPASPQFMTRKLPVVAAANIYEGGHAGGGVEFSLARTGVPFLQHVNVGLDYRFSAWLTGESYNAYSIGISAAE